MGTVRAFTPGDIPQVIELNTKLFPRSALLSHDRQEEIFSSVCFENPWHDGEISSLVHEEANGRLSGFLAVIPRKMLWRGTTIRVAVSQHLMVDHATLASVQLIKHLFSGPQDLTMTDMAVDVARKIWERAGGTTSRLHSFYWFRPLRIVASALSFFIKSKNELPRSRAVLFSSALDGVANKIPLNPFRVHLPDTTAEELSVPELLSLMGGAGIKRSLSPCYDPSSLAWLLGRLDREERFGKVQKKLVRSREGEIIGWFLYNLNPYGRSEVLQIEATGTGIDAVIRHLFYDAWKNNSTEIAGRLDPRHMREFAGERCLFNPGKNWMLVHARDRSIADAILQGDAWLSRLEGDLWLF